MITLFCSHLAQVNSKTKELAKLFEPPLDLMFQGSFDEVCGNTMYGHHVGSGNTMYGHHVGMWEHHVWTSCWYVGTPCMGIISVVGTPCMGIMLVCGNTMYGHHFGMWEHHVWASCWYVGTPWYGHHVGMWEHHVWTSCEMHM